MDSQLKNTDNLETIIVVLLPLGLLGNILMGYIAFKKKDLSWDLSLLIQNLVVSDLLHLILSGAYKIGSRNDSEFYQKTDTCALVYPVFTVTASNPNLAIFLIFVFHSYKMNLTPPQRISKNTLKGLLIVGWISCYFLFTPQVFVEDLTQVDQNCKTRSIDLIIEMRIAYWIGMLYLQILASALAFLYVFIAKRKLDQLEQSRVTLWDSKCFLHLVNTSTMIANTLCRQKQTTSDFKARDQNSENNDRSEKKKGRVVTFRESCNRTYSEPRSKRTFISYQRNKLILLSVFVLSHLCSLIPQNYFFFRYYFGSLSHPSAAMASFQTGTCFTFMNSLLNPIILVCLQSDVKKDLMVAVRFKLRKTRHDTTRHQQVNDNGKADYSMMVTKTRNRSVGDNRCSEILVSTV